MKKQQLINNNPTRTSFPSQPQKALFTSITPEVFNPSRLCGKLCILYTRTWSQRTVTNGAQTYLYKTINWTMYRLRRLPASVCVYNALQSVTLNQ